MQTPNEDGIAIIAVAHQSDQSKIHRLESCGISAAKEFHKNSGRVPCFVEALENLLEELLPSLPWERRVQTSLDFTTSRLLLPLVQNHL